NRWRPKTASAAGRGHLHEVAAVAALHERVGQGGQLVGGDVALPEGHLLGTADLLALPFLDDLDELGGLHHRHERPRVEPGGAPGEDGHPELAPLQVLPPVISYSPRALGASLLARATTSLS